MSKTRDISYKRHIAKSITWRLIGTLDTIILSWLISGDPFLGLQIGVTEVVTKMVLYYLHERFWFKYRFEGNQPSSKRHLLKTVSWRIVGTLDTMMLAWLISGNPMLGFKVGAVEIFTKMLLYFFHERIWYKVDYGLEHRRNTISSDIASHE
ncbi:DUF2061 domain-containing protein [Zhouia sp. PK063]|uniref:DUF2061 domain-containing protein n=1 Tax=Zhouia sp. PK063 TaxID=3373602 RepID=UPI00379473AD